MGQCFSNYLSDFSVFIEDEVLVYLKVLIFHNVLLAGGMETLFPPLYFYDIFHAMFFLFKELSPP